jgi:hypothetical protein
VRSESRNTADLGPTHSGQGFDDAALADRRFAATRQALQFRFEPLQIGDALPHFDQMHLYQAIDIAAGMLGLIRQLDQGANLIEGETEFAPSSS